MTKKRTTRLLEFSRIYLSTRPVSEFGIFGNSKRAVILTLRFT